MTKSFHSKDIDNTIAKFVDVLSEEYPELAFDRNNYSPILPHLSLILETIAILRLPLDESSDIHHKNLINWDVTDLTINCNATNLKNLLNAKTVDIERNKTKKNILRCFASFVVNVNFSKTLRYGHVAFDKSAKKLIHFRYAGMMRCGYNIDLRQKCARKLKLELPKRNKSLANLIYVLPVSLMEGLSDSLVVTSFILSNCEKFETSQGFLDFELVLLAWSKLLYPSLKTISVQHGGGYHHRSLPSLSERIELAFSDLCYNWVGVNDLKNISIPFPECLEVTPGRHIKVGSVQRVVVLSTYEGDGYTNLIQNKSAPQTTQELDEFRKFISDYTSILEQNFSKLDLIFRPPPKTKGYIESLSDNWTICDHRKSIKDYHDGTTLFIIDNLNTTLYQLLNAEIPFIFIHNKSMYGVNENFINFVTKYMPNNSYFDELQLFSSFLSEAVR